MTGNDIDLELTNILKEYEQNLAKEVEFRLRNWKFDHKKAASYQVISGLLSRQTSIVIDLLSAPQIFNRLVVSIILRSMIDIYITMAWILHSDSEIRAQKFIDYGLGQEKIMLDCRKAGLEAQGILPETDELVQTCQNLINMMKYEQLVDVNIGSWSGLNVRQMAQEAGCLDFYNLTYIPFSQDVHSNWSHLIRFNLEPCKNPLHKFHFHGVLKDNFPCFFDNLRNVVKYMNKVLDLFDANSGLDVSSVTPSADILIDKVLAIIEKIQKNKKPRK